MNLRAAGRLAGMLMLASVVLAGAVLAVGAAVAYAGPGDYRFTNTYQPAGPEGHRRARPVAQRCGPIRYLINSHGNVDHPRWLHAAHRAVADVSRRTGQRWVFDGYTRQSAVAGTFNRDRADGRVIIEFTWPRNGPQTPTSWGTPWRVGNQYRGGMLLVNPAVALRPWRTNRWAAGLFRHELGHVYGLDHVHTLDPELMRPAYGATHTYGPGDRNGLARLAAHCQEPTP